MKTLRSDFERIITAPPSKSHEQRLLAAALLSRSDCYIKDYGNSDDVIAARNIIRVLGADTLTENNLLKVSSTNQISEIPNADFLECNESALCARLFTPIAAIFRNSFTVNGKSSLLKRPIVNSFRVLKQNGWQFEPDNGFLPVKITRANIQSGQYFIDGSETSQFISGFIMALSVVYGDSRIIVKNPVSISYLLMTIQVLNDFGVRIKYSFETKNEMLIEISGAQTYKPGTFTVEGDWSGAAFILITGTIFRSCGIRGLNMGSVQADKAILEVFDLCKVKYYTHEDVLFVEKSYISAFEFNAVNCPDLIPALVILALYADGISHIYGADRLKTKESSRGEVLVQELTKAGVKISLNGDVLEICGNNKIHAAELNSYDDHRIAMAFLVLKLCSAQDIIISNLACVTKSWVGFEDVIDSLRDNV